MSFLEIMGIIAVLAIITWAGLVSFGFFHYHRKIRPYIVQEMHEGAVAEGYET